MENAANQNMGHFQEIDEMTELAIAMNDSWKFDDEENERQTPTTSKKWYEGVVIRPVAFRSSRKNRSSNQN